jgi:GNAT superfamily N-acetyltransferase
MDEVEVRPAESEAARARSLAIWNLVCPELATSAADERDYIAYCAGHLNLVAYLGGDAVGSGFAGIEPDAAGPAIAKAHVAVVPEAREHGAGTALYSAISAWAARQGRTALEAWVVDRDPAGLAFAARRGFREVMREALVALDLGSAEEPRVQAPAGVRIVTWAERPDLAPGMYEVMLEASPDIPGNDDAIPTYSTWLEHYMGGAADRPEATFVALAGEEVVGYAKLHLSEARPGVAVHDLTGVKRAWRGHGVARALKAAQIAWAKREGYERLETGNELRNAPIRKLNEAFGYRPIPGRALVRGPIATAEEER